jgi:penicillin-binding protein-related factor A (putative recombinase)
VPSKPDFEGVLANARQFILEAKVMSGPNLPMQKDKIKPRQISHMLARSRFGVPCFIVVHFNARNLVKARHPAITVAIPVSDADPRWERYVEAHAAAKREKRAVDCQECITRDEAQEIGKLVPWIVPKSCKKPLPDLLSFLWPEARAIRLPVVQPAAERVLHDDQWD